MDKSPLKQKLPAELLLMVLDELCPQLIQPQCRICVIAKCTCEVEGLGERKLDPELVKSVQGLAALNRPCKEVRQLTTRLLYACPLFTPNKPWWCHGELSKLVTTLFISENNTTWNQGLEVPPWVITYALDALRSFPLPVQERQLCLESNVHITIKQLTNSPPIDVMLSLCPNIERLCVYGPVIEIDFEAFLPEGTTFLALKTISIHDPNPPECDGTYELLATYTPNVETMYLRNDPLWWAPDPDLVILHNVKYFTMGGKMEVEDEMSTLFNLLSFVPNAQELVFNMGISEELRLEAKSRRQYTTRDPDEVASWQDPMAPTDVAKAVEKQGPSTKLRKITMNYMADYRFTDQDMLWVYEGQNPTINAVKRYVQRCRDELDEATETLARMGIDLECTIPPDDWMSLGCLNDLGH